MTDWRIDAGTLYLRGLHDPLTPTPQQLLAELGFSTDGYRLDFRPFESSDAVAALARARRRLSPPDTIELTLDDDGTLSARGSATASWIARAALLATTVPGVERYSDDQVENPDRLIERRLRESLQPPEGVDIEVHDGMAEVRGLAPLEWIVELNSSPPALDGLAALQTDVRRNLLAVYDLDPHRWTAVVLTGSGSTAVEAMLTSLIPDASPTLVVGNGVYGERVTEILGAHGMPAVPMHHTWGARLDPQEIGRLLDQCPDVRHVALVHHETTTGRLNDLAAMGAVCRQRDKAGMYQKAERGEIPDFPGVSTPYVAPESADLTLDTNELSIRDCVDRLSGLLAERRIIGLRTDT